MKTPAERRAEWAAGIAPILEQLRQLVRSRPGDLEANSQGAVILEELNVALYALVSAEVIARFQRAGPDPTVFVDGR